MLVSHVLFIPSYSTLIIFFFRVYCYRGKSLHTVFFQLFLFLFSFFFIVPVFHIALRLVSSFPLTYQKSHSPKEFSCDLFQQFHFFFFSRFILSFLSFMLLLSSFASYSFILFFLILRLFYCSFHIGIKFISLVLLFTLFSLLSFSLFFLPSFIHIVTKFIFFILSFLFVHFFYRSCHSYY